MNIENNAETAALLTIEKIREITGCPVGVDVQEWVKQLAAENAGLKAAHPQPFGPVMMKALDAYENHQDEVPETGMLDAFFILRDSILVDTTATDAFLADVRASGADECVRQLAISDDDDFSDAPNVCAMVAHQIRKGVQS